MDAAATPSIDDLVRQGWADHERDPGGVLERVGAALPRVDAAAQVPGLAALIVHVAGEHLGRWSDGLDLLERLAARADDPASSEGQALLRARATLLVCAGERARGDALVDLASGGDLPPASTRVRVLAVAASALAGQRQTRTAMSTFHEALTLAGYGPDASDPAARALAITGNNLACALEERVERTPDEDHLLELAARTARRFWEVAGGWVEVERAEYRLARTLLALGRPQEALAHARACLTTCEANGAGPDELLFAHEVLTLVHRAADRADAAAEHRARVAALALEVPPDLRELAASTLANLA